MKFYLLNSRTDTNIDTYKQNTTTEDPRNLQTIRDTTSAPSNTFRKFINEIKETQDSSTEQISCNSCGSYLSKDSLSAYSLDHQKTLNNYYYQYYKFPDQNLLSNNKFNTNE